MLIEKNEFTIFFLIEKKKWNSQPLKKLVILN